MRSLTLAVLAVVLAAAPAAHAEVADNYLPVFTASEGISVKVEKRQVRFGAKADKIYRGIRGRKAMSVCAGISTQLTVDTRIIVGPVALPRKRGNLKLMAGGTPDVCALATARPNSVDLDKCQPLTTDLPEWCTRVIFAVTDRGRAYLDQLQRSYELFYTDSLAFDQPAEFGMAPLEWLQGALGDVVALPTADASPPAGKVGFWQQGTSHVVAALLLDGKRRFLRRDGDVVSTNDHRLLAQTLTVF
jgi:hypothetical protein